MELARFQIFLPFIPFMVITDLFVQIYIQPGHLFLQVSTASLFELKSVQFFWRHYLFSGTVFTGQGRWFGPRLLPKFIIYYHSENFNWHSNKIAMARAHQTYVSFNQSRRLFPKLMTPQTYINGSSTMWPSRLRCHFFSRTGLVRCFVSSHSQNSVFIIN